jgi:hypothetical protein
MIGFHIGKNELPWHEKVYWYNCSNNYAIIQGDLPNTDLIKANKLKMQKKNYPNN